MIIVSQDKDSIVNFNNINVIQINDFDDKSPFQRIIAKTDKDYAVLGDYKTEERAKEVLREIIKLYAEKNLTIDNIVHKNVDYPKIYEMPEE